MFGGSNVQITSKLIPSSISVNSASGALSISSSFGDPFLYLLRWGKKSEVQFDVGRGI